MVFGQRLATSKSFITRVLHTCVVQFCISTVQDILLGRSREFGDGTRVGHHGFAATTPPTAVSSCLVLRIVLVLPYRQYCVTWQSTFQTERHEAKLLCPERNTISGV